MQEQGISLDETDKCGNSAVHIASQHGYLGCIQVIKNINWKIMLRCIMIKSLMENVFIIIH